MRVGTKEAKVDSRWETVTQKLLDARKLFGVRFLVGWCAYTYTEKRRVPGEALVDRQHVAQLEGV